MNLRKPQTGALGCQDDRLRRTGWTLVLAGVVVLASWAGVTCLQVVRHARSLDMHLRRLQALAEEVPGTDVQGALGEHFSGLRCELEALEAWTHPLQPLGRFLAWVPAYGPDLAAADDLLELATGVAVAAERTYHALAPALAVLDQGPTGHAVGGQLLPLLVAAQPELEAAKRELVASELARTRLRTARLSARAAGWVGRLDGYTPVLMAVLETALLAPDLLGWEAPRTYLVLAQNNHELRATGGFISGVGELTIQSGRIVSLVFVDSYAVDNLDVPHEETPIAFQQTLFGELWFLRDANWNADFPTSARRALEIYARDRGKRVQGVLAVDLIGLQRLVEAVGPLQIEGVETAVTSENFIGVVQAQWDNPIAGPALEEGWDQQWWQHRKDFTAEVAGAVLERLLSGDGVEAERLAGALTSALDEKHLLVYLSDPDAAALLRERDWDGALPDPYAGTDLLLVVDSNVGFNKADANVARAIAYQVDLGAERAPEARLTVSYVHTVQRPAEACLQQARYRDSYAEMTERCYWDYLRVYVPPGSTLLKGPDVDLPPGSLLARIDPRATETVSPALTEGGMNVWAAFFELETGRERTLGFTYRLPSSLVGEEPGGILRYRLRVQKQPGTEAVPFHLELLLPPDAVVLDASPPDLGASLFVSTYLRVDREFEIAYRLRGDR